LNAHTARAYAAAQRDYQAFAKRSGQSDLSVWVGDMQKRGLVANTICQRLYLVRAWLDVEEDVASLPARRTVREIKWLDADLVRTVLSVIPKDDNGRHGFALLTALLVTGCVKYPFFYHLEVGKKEPPKR
jgi:hypothetical protein